MIEIMNQASEIKFIFIYEVNFKVVSRPKQGILRIGL